MKKAGNNDGGTTFVLYWNIIKCNTFGNLRTALTFFLTEAIDHSSNLTMAFTNNFTSRIFCKCKCHCWVWRMIDSLYYSSRKIPERCENSFVNYRINYQKLCYSLRRIWTQPMKSLVIDTKSNTKSIMNGFQFIVTTWVCIFGKCLLSCLFINTEYLDARFVTNYKTPPGCY